MIFVLSGERLKIIIKNIRFCSLIERKDVKDEKTEDFRQKWKRDKCRK